MMKKIRPLVILILSVCLLAVATGTFADQNAEEAAMKAATSWLALVDAGKYQECWDRASGYLKMAVSAQDFGKSLTAARAPLGALVSRTASSKTYATTLPGAPDGEYVVIQFNTRFANKQSAVETVTPMRDKDGVWRVSGYYIR